MARRLLAAALGLALLGAAPARAGSFRRFEPGRDGHSWANAYLLALASHYASPRKVQDMPGANDVEKARERFRRLGLDLVDFLDRTTSHADTQVLVLRDDALLLVVFAGSEGRGAGSVMRDWILTDLRIQQVLLGNVHVHKGFQLAAEAVYADLRELVRRELGGRALWMTGHSLGGALANLVAYRFEDDGLPVQGVVTFAAPRVGDDGWAREFEARFGARSQQWVLAADPFPLLPPSAEGRDYETVGVTNVLESDGGVDLDGEQETMLLPNFMDHRTVVYVYDLYRAVPDRLRPRLPKPPPRCSAFQRLVGTHPSSGLPLCKTRGSVKMSLGKCKRRGGDPLPTWCAFDEPHHYRHRVRPLK